MQTASPPHGCHLAEESQVLTEGDMADKAGECPGLLALVPEALSAVVHSV